MPRARGAKPLAVVVFSGGRGSQVLSEELVARPEIRLTLAINGYDDGHSTGAVRRLLDGALGPSDFRKNAARMARALGSCPPALVSLLDLRLPDRVTGRQAAAFLALGDDPPAAGAPSFQAQLHALVGRLEGSCRATLRARLARFEAERARDGRPFPYGDCSLGNLVFAGGFLEAGCQWNRALEGYTALLGLPPGLIENVTDGTDAHLVAIARDGRLLATEAEIVDTRNPSAIEEIALLDRPPSAEERASLRHASPAARRRFLAARRRQPGPNPRLLARLAAADLVVYAPGTQHSSLFPSYLTPGVGAAIAGNTRAIKVLVSNLRPDAEIPGASAVDIVERALFYLREQGRRPLPAPCLVTHVLIHDPSRAEEGVPHVPLGRLRNLEDPRLLRLGDFEDGATGRHDAAKVLTPFIDRLLRPQRPEKVAVLLLDAGSLDKAIQTVLEALRAGLERLPFQVRFLHAGTAPAETRFAAALPVPLLDVGHPGETPHRSLLRALRAGPGDGGYAYAVLFESSGMYHGDEIVNLLSLLGGGRLDAVWGSRRLSVRDIHASYRYRYRRNPWLGALSYAGSHLLSLAHLVLYGRYVTDSLSGVRAVRAAYLDDPGLDLADVTANQRILAAVLRRQGTLFETPVRFLSMSPRQVRRIGALDGLRCLATVLRERLRRRSLESGETAR